MDTASTPSATVAFTFQGGAPPDLVLLDLVWRWDEVEALDDDARWPDEACELARSGGTGLVRVSHQVGTTLIEASRASDADDVLLAVALAVELARASGVANVVQEGHGPIPVGDLVRLYDRHWADEVVAWALLTAADQAARLTGAACVCLRGPSRDFMLGRETLARLDPSDEARFPGRLLEALRRMQWPNSHVAADLSVGDPTPPGVNRTSESAAVLRRSSTGSLIRRDGVALVLDDAGDGPPRFVRMPMEAVLRRLEPHVHPVDEHHVFLDSLDDPTWTALVAPPPLPSPPPPPPSPAATTPPAPPARRTGDCWVWIVDRDVTYLAFEFLDPDRGMKARGDRVSSPPTAAEVQAAVERPSHTFPTDAGMWEVRDLSLDEQIDLGLPVAPPWAE